MNALRWQRLKGLYFQATEMPESARRGFLDECCSEDEELRGELDRLLAVQVDDDFLEHPDGGSLARAAERTPPSPLRRLGDFELLEEIGAGAMGRVFRAHQESLDREVAVKIMQPGLTLSTRQVERFRLEATNAAKLRHPSIVGVHSVGEVGGVHFYSMDLVEGPSLASVLEDLRAADDIETSTAYRRLLGESSLGYFGRAAQLVAELAEALQYSHERRIVHRDVKPGNVMIDRAGRPLLADFGLAQDLELESLYHSASISGTPYYMSPEQARRASARLDHRTDIFSLGVVLYELLTLERPFRGETSHEVFRAIQEHEPLRVRRVNPRVPRDLETICARAVEKDPARRYVTAHDFAQDLRRFLSHESIHARPANAWERGRRLARRHRRLLQGATLAAASALLGVFLASTWRDSDVLAQGRERAAAVLADPSSSLGALTEAREVLRVSAHVGERQEVALTGALEERIEARAREEVDRGLEHLRRGLAGQEAGLPGGDLAALVGGFVQWGRGAAELPEEGFEEALERIAELRPRIHVDTGGVPAELFLDRLDPDTGRVLERARLGRGTEQTFPVDFGYWRVTAVAPGLGTAERTLALDRVDHVEPVALALRPTEEVTRDMVLVDGGSFVFGTGTPGRVPFPRRTEEVAPFWIDREEVTQSEYREFVLETGHPLPWLWDGGYDEAWDELPMVGVSFHDAEAYAAWTGKRLPTALEWERAARGRDGWDYPWGVEAGQVESWARVGRDVEDIELTEPAEVRRAERAEYLANVLPVQALPEGRSPDGLYHVLGNAREWTETLFRHKRADGTFAPRVGSIVVKGGTWSSKGVTLSMSQAVPADIPGRSLGFRCAKSVWP